MNGSLMDKELVTRKRIKRIKRRLLPSLLAGFSLPFTLFLFGPFDLFAQNRAAFAFSLYDFILPCFLLTLVCGGILSTVALFLPKKAYSLYLAVLFWASVMLFLQGNYLNIGLTSLAGDGISEGASFLVVAINTAIWLISLAALMLAVIKLKPVRKKLRGVVCFGIALILVMQTVGVAAVSFEDGVYNTKAQVLSSRHGQDSQRFLTTQNLTALSSEHNVVVFVVDRFDAKYYKKASKEAPEVFGELEGFTYYDNHISLYARTFPAVAHMLTGYENDYSDLRQEYFENAYSSAEYLKYMSEQGYGVNIYTDSYYGYENASVMQEYADNLTGYSQYRITDRAALIGNMLALSLYRYLPFILKGFVEDISTDDFSRLVEFESDAQFSKYSTDNREVYSQMSQSDFELYSDGGRFSFIHISGCHIPTKYDADWNDLADSSSDIVTVVTQSFKIISRYIFEMKRLGVYEDSTIIITGDHAAAVSDKNPVDDARVTAMLVKQKGVSEGDIKVSNAPTCHDDIWATIFDSEGLDYKCDKGISMLDIDENMDRERKYIFHRMIDSDNAQELEYRVVGDAKDFAHWNLVGAKDIHGVHN